MNRKLIPAFNPETSIIIEGKTGRVADTNPADAFRKAIDIWRIIPGEDIADRLLWCIVMCGEGTDYCKVWWPSGQVGEGSAVLVWKEKR